MKKIILYGVIIILTLSFVYGITTINNYLTKESAYTDFYEYKNTTEKTLEKVATSITYTTNKTCEIDYKSEKALCGVCFNFSYLNDTYNRCKKLNENSTLSEDNIVVRNYVKTFIDNIMDKEVHKYTVRVMVGESIELLDSTTTTVVTTTTITEVTK